MRGTIQRGPENEDYTVSLANGPITVDRKNIRGRVVVGGQWQAPFYGTGAGEPNVVGGGSANDFLLSEIDPLVSWSVKMLESYVRHLIATTKNLTVKKCLNYPRRGNNEGTGQIPDDDAEATSTSSWEAAERRLDPIEHKKWKALCRGGSRRRRIPYGLQCVGVAQYYIYAAK